MGTAKYANYANAGRYGLIWFDCLENRVSVTGFRVSLGHVGTGLGEDAGRAARSTGRHVSRFQSGVMPPHSQGGGGSTGRNFGRDGELTM